MEHIAIAYAMATSAERSHRGIRVSITRITRLQRPSRSTRLDIDVHRQVGSENASVFENARATIQHIVSLREISFETPAAARFAGGTEYIRREFIQQAAVPPRLHFRVIAYPSRYRGAHELRINAILGATARLSSRAISAGLPTRSREETVRGVEIRGAMIFDVRSRVADRLIVAVFVAL